MTAPKVRHLTPRTSEEAMIVLSDKSRKDLAELLANHEPTRKNRPIWRTVAFGTITNLGLEHRKVRHIVESETCDGKVSLTRRTLTFSGSSAGKLVLPKGTVLQVCDGPSSLLAYSANFSRNGRAVQLNIDRDGRISYTEYPNG